MGYYTSKKSSLKTFRNELGFNIPSLSKETSMLNKIRYENKFLKVVVMVLIVFTTFWSSPVSAQDKINPRVLKDTENGQTAHFLVYLSQQAHPGNSAAAAQNRDQRG